MLRVGLGASQFNIRFDVAADAGEFFIRRQLGFHALAVAEDALRLFLIVQKFGSEVRCSRIFRRARFCGTSKIAPHKLDALLQSFVLVLQIFKNHAMSGKPEPGGLFCLSESQ